MATYRLKRKTFATMVDLGNGQVGYGAAPVQRSQAYYDQMAKEATVVNGSPRYEMGNKIGTDAAHNNSAQVKAQQAANDAKFKKQAFKRAEAKGFKAGQNSVGIKKGAMNTWRNMGTAGKIGTIAGGAALAGLAAKGLMGNKKD